MTRTIALVIAATMAAGSGAAVAANTNLSRAEQAKVNSLPYTMAEDVRDRMGPEQTVSGIVETKILNEIATDGFTEVRDVEVLYRARALDEQGEWRLVDIDPSTYEVSETAAAIEEHASYDPTEMEETRSSEEYNPKAGQPAQTGSAD